MVSFEELRRYGEYMQKRLKGCADVSELKLFGSDGRQSVFLGEIARIDPRYQDPPQMLFRHNGQSLRGSCTGNFGPLLTGFRLSPE